MPFSPVPVRFFSFLPFGSVLLWVVVISGCSPRFDWREIPLADVGLTVLLPCKPDRGERAVTLAGQPAVIRMAGCDAGGATFAVAYTPVLNMTEAAVVQNQWYEATRHNIRAADTGPPLPGKGTPYSPPGAAAMPPPMLVTLHGQRPGSPTGTTKNVTAYAAWHTRTAGAAVYVVHAVMYSERNEPEATETFFSGIQMR